MTVDCTQFVNDAAYQAPLACEPGNIWIGLGAIVAIGLFYGLLFIGLRLIPLIPMPAYRREVFVARRVMSRHRAFWVALAGIAMPLALPLIPGASALGGTPPTLDCQVDFAPSVGNTGEGVKWLNTDTSGNAYFSVRDNLPAGGSHDTVYKYDTSCVLGMFISDNCPSTRGCTYGPYFPFGKDQTEFLALAHGTETTSPGTDDELTIELRYASNGTLFQAFSTPFTTERVADPLDNSVGEMPEVYFIRESDTDGDYLVRGERAFVSTATRWSSDFTGRDWQATTTGEFLNRDPFRPLSSTQFLLAKPGAPTIQVLRNLTTGASMATSAGFTTCGNGGSGLFSHHSTVNISRIYTETCPGGVGAGANVGYGVINATDLTTVTASAAFTPAKIDDGGLRATTAQGAQWDGIDDLLSCGVYDIGAPSKVAYFAKFLTSNNTMHWNVTLDINAGPAHGSGRLTAIEMCRLDNVSGLWVAGRYVNAAGKTIGFIQHYSGGGFTNPTLPPGTTILVAPTQPPAAADIAVGFNVFFTNICGTSEGSLFFCGLVLVVTGMVVTGSAVTGVTKKENRKSDSPAVMVAVAIAGTGIMLFNGMASIWPGWVTLGFILIVGAVVAFFFRNTFAGRE